MKRKLGVKIKIYQCYRMVRIMENNHMEIVSG